MKKLILILALALTACAAPKPQVVYVPKVVKVPVPVKCSPPKIDTPTYDFDNAKKGDLLYNDLALLAAENDHLNAYSTKLKAALDGCTK
jgi:hypothetical protein